MDTPNEYPDGSERYHTTSLAEARGAVWSLLQEARHRIDILSPDLDPQVYDQQPVLDSLRRIMVDGGRRARIRILVANGAQLAQRGHRLIELARQLPSYMQIRQLAEEDRAETPAWVCADSEGFARWDSDAGYHGFVATEGRAEALRLERAFDELWERSRIEPALRRLSL